jgi:alpha-glucosidase
MPPGIWRAHEPCPRDDGTHDPELPELLIRGGAILPLGPVMQFVDEHPTDPLTLVVCPNQNFEASGRLYEDAGDGHAHADGHFRLSTYRARREADFLIVERADVQGRLHEHERHKHDRAVEVIVLLDDGQVRTGHGRDGQAISIRL